jgi:hypothetical protein
MIEKQIHDSMVAKRKIKYDKAELTKILLHLKMKELSLLEALIQISLANR